MVISRDGKIFLVNKRKEEIELTPNVLVEVPALHLAALCEAARAGLVVPYVVNHVRCGEIKPRWRHNCQLCVFVGISGLTPDVYLHDNGNGLIDLIRRYTDEPGAYSSTSLNVWSFIALGKDIIGNIIREAVSQGLIGVRLVETQPHK